MDKQTQSAGKNEPSSLKYSGPQCQNHYWSIDGKNPRKWVIEAAQRYSVQFDLGLCADEIRAWAAVIEKDAFLGSLEQST